MTDMREGTARMLRVRAQWALWGKEGPGVGYHLLGCSTGPVTPENFSQLLTRYSPGTLESLPQVTLSWFRHGPEPEHYLGIAIHHTGAPPQASPGSAGDVALTSYFCLPFSESASYAAMFERFRAIALPAEPGPPVSAELDATGPRPPGRGDDLALRAAALLLTGMPVCVLGADQAGLAERLGFLDTAAALLPAGLRRQLSAATWTSSNFAEHRFRLFFASAPRAGRDDVIVRWDAPEPGPRPGTWAAGYLSWLRAGPARRARLLAAQRQPLSFRRPAEVFECLGIPVPDGAP
jgi:hypothetical protein